MSITINAIHKSFQSVGGLKRVLAGASLTVPSGGGTCLTGSNGSGKTTLLKIAATLICADIGSVLIDGIDTARNPAAARERLALAGGDDQGFYESISVRQNLLFAGRLRNIPGAALEQRIATLADRLALTSWMNEPVSHCSSGIRRSLSLLRAALSEPAVLLLDEPTNSLDDHARAIVGNFLKDEMARGCSCLMVTHDRRDAAMLGAPLMKLSDGQVHSV